VPSKIELSESRNGGEHRIAAGTALPLPNI
jgi:hypothetical protein